MFLHRWSLHLRDKLSGQESEEIFDAVLVCTGHHGSVHWPKFPGADEFQVRQIYPVITTDICFTKSSEICLRKYFFDI